MSARIELALQSYSQEMEYGTIARWFKREGDPVVAGEVLLEVEADKVTQEVVAPVSGVLETIYAVAGDEIRVGEVMGALVENPSHDSVRA